MSNSPTWAIPWQAVQHNNASLMPGHPCGYLVVAWEVGMVCLESELPIQQMYGPNDLDILPVLQLSHLALLLRFALQAKHLHMGCWVLGSHGWHSSTLGV